VLWALPDAVQQVRYVREPPLKGQILPSRSTVLPVYSQANLLGRTLEGAELSLSTPLPRALIGVKGTQHPAKGAQILSGLVPAEGVTAEG